jgi:hypothetical protein
MAKTGGKQARKTPGDRLPYIVLAALKRYEADGLIQQGDTRVFELRAKMRQQAGGETATSVKGITL